MRTRQSDPNSGRRARQVGQNIILAVSLAAPIAIGGALPGVQVALAAGAVAGAAVWAYARRGDLHLPPFGLVAVVALAYTLLQLVPLPATLVGLLSPQALAVRTDALGAAPAFLPLTMDVPATLLAAARGAACIAVLVVASGVSKRGKAELLLAPLVCVGGGIALLAFAQRALGADAILGFYKAAHLPGSGFFGTFVNGNQAAAFFTVAGLLGWGMARETDGGLRVAFAVAALLCLGGVIFTGSRFGLVGAAAGAFVLLAVWLLGILGTVRGLIASGIAALLAGPLAYALAAAASYRSVSVARPQSDFKVRGWLDALQVVQHYPLAGVGRGAFEAPATAYRHNPEGVRLIFPENLLLEMGSEWGVPVSLALIGLFAWHSWPIVKRLRRWEPLYQSAAAAVVAVLVHDFADFSLELLGVAMPAALALGVVAGRRQMGLEASSRTSTLNTSPSAWVLGRVTLALVAGMAVVGGAAWAVPRTSDAEGDQVREAIKRGSRTTESTLAAAIARHPAEHDFALLAARWAMRLDPPGPAAMRQLNRAQRLYPSSPQPHIMTALVLMRLGRPSQAALELRLANDLGAGLAYAQIERMVGPAQLERAVPRNPEQLFNLAHYLVAVGRPAEAASAADRAVGLAQETEASLARRAEIALAGHDKAKDKTFLGDAARALARVSTSTESYELAIRGLATAGDLEGAAALIRRAGVAFPHEGLLTVQGARLLLQHGQPATARALVNESARRSLTVADRIAGEELLAEIAEKEGDPASAAAARARARLLAHLRDGGGH